MLEALRTKVLGWRLGLVCAVESLLWSTVCEGPGGYGDSTKGGAIFRGGKGDLNQNQGWVEAERRFAELSGRRCYWLVRWSWGLEISGVHLLKRPQLTSDSCQSGIGRSTGGENHTSLRASSPLGVSEHQVPILILLQSAALSGPIWSFIIIAVNG